VCVVLCDHRSNFLRDHGALKPQDIILQPPPLDIFPNCLGMQMQKCCFWFCCHVHGQMLDSKHMLTCDNTAIVFNIATPPIYNKKGVGGMAAATATKLHGPFRLQRLYHATLSPTNTSESPARLERVGGTRRRRNTRLRPRSQTVGTREVTRRLSHSETFRTMLGFEAI
jgi:hypothetical protein